jgi:hypothetical protein
MRNLLKTAFTILVSMVCLTALGQSNPVPVSAPFLLIPPDARSSGMGEVGVATSNDAYSNYWNNAKTAFSETPAAVSFTYMPWLRSITPGLNYLGASGYNKLDYNSAISFEVRYLSEQKSIYRDSTGVETGIKNPFDLSVGASYSLQLTDQYSIGIGGKIIHSGVDPNQGTTNVSDANAFGLDLGFYSVRYIKDVKFSWGVMINNLGNKIGYGDGSSFQPTNLRIGAAANILAGDNSSFTIGLDLNKLLVPTPPIIDSAGNIIKGKSNNVSALKGVLGSFTDAPNGFSEEMQEIKLGIGIEYEYMHQFFLRAGGVYQSPNKGEQRYLTAGLGFNYDHISVDGSYILPIQSLNPYQNTFHLTLTFYIESKNN